MREWVEPGTRLEQVPWRPEPVRAADGQWAYVPPRRVPAYVESSIGHGLQWVVFEPNGEALWSQVRQQVTDYLLGLWRAGTLQGDRPEDAFFVRCDRSTMTQDDLDNGRLVVLVGVATLKPAEFVVFRIGQWTADVDQESGDSTDDPRHP